MAEIEAPVEMGSGGEDAAVIVGRMKLGSQGLEVSRQGLGCMSMSDFYGPPKPESDMVELIRYAVDKGITLLDTSNSYGPETNELLLGKALADPTVRHKVQLATKFGIQRTQNAVLIHGDPEYVRACCEDSLDRLGVEYIDLYYQHRIDTTMPIEITVRTGDLVNNRPPSPAITRTANVASSQLSTTQRTQSTSDEVGSHITSASLSTDLWQTHVPPVTDNTRHGFN